MINGVLGSLFGGFGCPYFVDQRDVTRQFYAHITARLGPEYFTIPPGITWERTGGKTHRVVIRRAPEVVPNMEWAKNSAGPARRAVPLALNGERE